MKYMENIVLRGEKISFSYDGVKVLKDCSFSVGNRDFAAVVGSNGAGKSTLLKICLGLLKPDQGNIWLFENSIDKFEEWDKIGYVPQRIMNLNLGFPATVEEVVSAPLHTSKKLKNLTKNEKKNLTDKSLEAVGMSQYRNRLIGRLSAGQQQRIFIAKALVSSPQLLFLDEPTTGIDNKTEEDFYKLIYKLNKDDGITIVMVTHDYTDIKSMVNRVIQISDGGISDKIHKDEDGDKK
ncbi:zinc transport system ATP-binding protein [Lutispora thermophila DSM 19022]|uniref:Zinc transport system ATP-binding protein n=2 Tax=Lutispora TaxID=667112 RepID=A0A1M6IMC5_9FIRM|nr:zinc transport system ATP-binding protein [Lutispora thermophila DSM 19022]